jgi:hypothetical protein
VSFVSNGLFYKKQTERAFVAEKAMQAKSDSTLHHSIFLVQYSIFCGSLLKQVRSAAGGSASGGFKPWGAGINRRPYSLGHLST